MAKKILISVGGTGGHIFPAQSLAEQLGHEEFQFLFVGAYLKTNPYFNSKSFDFLEISASSLSLKEGIKLISKGFSILKGVFQSIKILRSYKPDLIIGFGSFHTLPLLLAARLLRKPYYLHEQNIQLGRVNKLLAGRSKAIISPYTKTKPYFPKKNVRAKMPLKFWHKDLPSKKEARKLLGLNLNSKTILIYGGSQGALAINELFLEALIYLKGTSFQVLHLVGKNFDIKRAKLQYEREGIDALVKEYEKQMLIWLRASDFCISRSGASTIAEQIEFELPSVLIPYPHASNHQELNADYMQDQVLGGIKLIEKDLNASLLAKILQNFLSDSTRETYIQNIQAFKQKNKTLSFADFIKEEIIKNGRQ